MATDYDQVDESKPEDEDIETYIENLTVHDEVDGPEMTAKSLNKAIARNEDLATLSDEQCLLATPWLKGLDLKTKEWGKLADVSLYRAC